MDIFPICHSHTVPGARLRERVHDAQVHSERARDAGVTRQLRLPSQPQLRLPRVAAAPTSQVLECDVINPFNCHPGMGMT